MCRPEGESSQAERGYGVGSFSFAVLVIAWPVAEMSLPAPAPASASSVPRLCRFRGGLHLSDCRRDPDPDVVAVAVVREEQFTGSMLRPDEGLDAEFDEHRLGAAFIVAVQQHDGEETARLCRGSETAAVCNKTSKGAAGRETGAAGSCPLPARRRSTFQEDGRLAGVGVQRRRDVGKNAPQRTAEHRQRADEADGNEGGDESVFDGGGAALVFQKRTDHDLRHSIEKPAGIGG